MTRTALQPPPQSSQRALRAAHATHTRALRSPFAALIALAAIFALAACGGATSGAATVASDAAAQQSAAESGAASAAHEAADARDQAQESAAQRAAEAQPEIPRMLPNAPPADAAVGVRVQEIGLAPGAPVPPFAAEDSAGAAMASSAIFGEGDVLVVFYRGGWCPFCAHQLHELMGIEEDLKRLGVQPVAISVDRQSEASRTAAAFDLPFPVLSDPDLSAHRAFGVTMTVAAEEVERLREMGLDIEAASGRDHHALAVPALFLVDASGTVRWAHSEPDYRVRPSPEQLVRALAGLER